MKGWFVILCVLIAVYLSEGKAVAEEKTNAATLEGKDEANVEAKAKSEPEPVNETVTPEDTKTSSFGNTDLDDESSDEDDENEEDSGEEAKDRSDIPKKDVVAVHQVDVSHERGHVLYSHEIQPQYHHEVLYCHKRRNLYHMYMTPTWLKSHASFIDTTSEINNHQLRFTRYTNRDNPRLIKVPLVDAGVVKDDEPITVEITVSMSKTLGTYRDSDIRYVLSDGDDCYGVETCNKADYRIYPPCYGIEGKSGNSLSKMVWVSRKRGRTIQNSYPGEFKFHFKTQERWAACSASVPGGYTNAFHFSKKLKQSKGLKLEVYKQGKNEQVGIKYILVNVRREG